MKIGRINMNKYIRIILSAMLTLLMLQTVSASTTGPTKIMIQFDDGWTNQIYTAFPILHLNGQNATAYIITERPNLSTSGQLGNYYMNVSQLQTLYEAGWDISSHTVTHAHLKNLVHKPAKLNYELNASKEWLNSMGFTRSSMFFAYPYGEYNQAVEDAVKSNGYLTARTVNMFNFTGNYYELPTLLVNSQTTPAYIENEIQKKEKENNGDGFLIITFHRIVDSANTKTQTEYSTANFRIVSNYLKNESDKGNISVVTISEWSRPH
jgi:peptidoglycan/xylan/chitin deacetylase (PgdA/CDA1 family)